MKSTPIQKIRITGGSGAGKTYLGKILTSKLNLPLISVDTLVYDFSKTQRFDHKRSDKDSKHLITKATNRKKWIIEGSFYTLTTVSFDNAHLIIFLRPTFSTRILNTIKRFFKRLLSGNTEGFRNFISLTSHNFKKRKKWQSDRVLFFKKKYGNKFMIFSSSAEAIKWFNKQI